MWEHAGSTWPPRGATQSLDEVEQTVVAAGSGTLVRVRDVATVQWGYADPVHITRWNGRRALFVTVTKQDDTNISDVRDRIWQELDAEEALLPAGVHAGARLRPVEERGRAAGAAGRRLRHRAHAGDRDAAPAGLAREPRGDGVDPALAGDRRGAALLHRLLDQPAVDRRVRDRARTAGGRLDRGGGEHHALPAGGLFAAATPPSRPRSRSRWRCSDAPSRSSSRSCRCCSCRGSPGGTSVRSRSRWCTPCSRRWW